jgi:hypothetical protein
MAVLWPWWACSERLQEGNIPEQLQLCKVVSLIVCVRVRVCRRGRCSGFGLDPSWCGNGRGAGVSAAASRVGGRVRRGVNYLGLMVAGWWHGGELKQ